MDLRYYLRGLGLGMIVTALVLGIHFYKSGTGQMTDAEVKQRAAELGMVDGNATLADNAEVISADELLETIDSDAETIEEADTKKESDTDQDVVEEDDVDENPDANLDQKISELEETTEDIKKEVDAVTDAIDDPDAPSGSNTEENVEIDVTNTGETVTLVISSGDSSYRVAQKLVDLGLVDDAHDYDLYLCNNGYDRYIRTGTYSIGKSDTNEMIAKAITGK